MSDKAKTRRSIYEEGCIAAHALDLVGDRWAILVLRELMLGPKRFGALRAGMPGLSANILTRRLTEMQAAGLLVRTELPPPASVTVYALTPLGLSFQPVISALCRWGAQAPGHDPSKFVSPTGLMLSFSAMIGNPAGVEAEIGFDFGSETFRATIGAAGFAAHPAPPEAALCFAGTANAVAAVFYGPLPVPKSLARFGVALKGDAEQAQAVIDLFRLTGSSADR